MGNIERWPERTWYALVCPTCGKQRDLFCHDHGEPVKIEAVEVVPTDQHQGAVEERDALLRFVRNYAKWHTTADLNRLDAQARGLLAAFGGQ